MTEMVNYYHENPYQREVETKVKGAFEEEEGVTCIQVYDNIFYPHGGGQKGDKGILLFEDGTKIHIIDTIKDEYSSGVLLITDQTMSSDHVKEKPLKCILNWEFRYKQMRLHSAVHFHHCMLEKALGKQVSHPATSDINDGYAYNKYNKNKDISSDLIDKANQLFISHIKDGAEVKSYPDEKKEEGFRWWDALGYKIPCGGTHIANLKEIGDIDITVSSKKGKSTISMALKD